MAKKKNKRGVRVYRPHNLGTILYSLLGLAAIACLAAFVMLPFFTYAKDGAEQVFTGLDYVAFIAKSTIETLKGLGLSFLSILDGKFDAFGDKFNAFNEYFGSSTTPDNQLLAVIFQIHGWIEVVICFFFILVVIFAFFGVLFSLIFLLRGKSGHPKGVNNMAWLSFWFFAVAFGFTFMYIFFYTQIITNIMGRTEDHSVVTITLSYESLMVLGGMFVICLLNYFFYRGCLKDRVALEKDKRKRGKEEVTVEVTKEDNKFQEEPIEEEPLPTEESAPIEEEPNQEVKAEKTVVLSPTQNNNGVITIANNAYAKNVEITEVNVPDGVSSLGSSAFANCVNLVEISFPATVQNIGFNCFFNTPKLKKIVFRGTVEQWKTVKRGSNWLTKSGTKTVTCVDGRINVNTAH